MTIYPVVNCMVNVNKCDISQKTLCYRKENDSESECPICFNYYFNTLFLKYIYNKIDITGRQFGTTIIRTEFEKQKRWSNKIKVQTRLALQYS